MSQTIHRVKRAEVTYSERHRSVSITFVYDELAEESETNKFALDGETKKFFGEVTLEQEVVLFLSDGVDPNEFIASLGFRRVGSLD